jgi:predicted ATP-grasp superfamily ATP-dependent carboligase
LESSGVAKNWIGKYQGRIVGDSSRAYSQPEDVEGTLTKAYIDAYDSLRIFGGQVSTQQLDEQAQRINDLEARLEEAVEKAKRTSSVEARLARLEKLLEERSP